MCASESHRATQTLVVHLDDDLSALMRVLNPFALLQIRPDSIRYGDSNDRRLLVIALHDVTQQTLDKLINRINDPAVYACVQESAACQD